METTIQFNESIKYFYTIMFFFVVSVCLGQTEIQQKKYRKFKPNNRVDIWDKEHSEKRFSIDTIGYDDIPKYLDFRGTILEALQWKDVNGEHILIQTLTRHFNGKLYLDKEDSTDYIVNEKSEIYAYHFLKKKNKLQFDLVWRINEYSECTGLDFSGFISKATTITDVDSDGISEITIPYLTVCQESSDSGLMTIYMYEGNTLYAVAGEMPFCDGERPITGSIPSFSSNTGKSQKFFDFLQACWSANQCKKSPFY